MEKMRSFLSGKIRGEIRAVTFYDYEFLKKKFYIMMIVDWSFLMLVQSNIAAGRLQYKVLLVLK